MGETAKQSLRRSLLAKRRSLPRLEWQRKSQQICNQLRALSIVQQSTTILAYFSFRQEPDLNALFTTEKTWGFPRCVGADLSWHTLSGSPPQVGTHGLIEPPWDSPLVEPDRVDLILIPCVACDRRGYRVGYGGGFYDRLLSAPDWQGKPTIGVVFEFAVVSELAIDPWDQPMQGICTEREYLSASASLL